MEAQEIIQLIKNKREIEVARRLEYMQSLNKKGIREPDDMAKAISKKVGWYTKLLADIYNLQNVEEEYKSTYGK